MAKVTVPCPAPVVEITWEGMLPVPDDRNPENPAVAEAVQLKVVPAMLEERTTGIVDDPEHIFCVSSELVTEGLARIVMDMVAGVAFCPLFGVKV